jgi:hypothetical protein
MPEKMRQLMFGLSTMDSSIEACILAVLIIHFHQKKNCQIEQTMLCVLNRSCKKRNAMDRFLAIYHDECLDCKDKVQCLLAQVIPR